MKAVILAGGKGDELLPLTVHTPKSMLPLLNRPCMAYTVELLKQHGIADIGVSLQYCPDLIRDYFGDGSRFGVSLTYFEEQRQTAGDKNNQQSLAEFLNDTCVVIRGDILTDCNLSEALSFHREKRSMATFVLSGGRACSEGLQVWTNRDGVIAGVADQTGGKDSFGVGTGIFLLEPEIFSVLQAEVNFLRPEQLAVALFRQGMPLGGYVMTEYWSGIDSLPEYKQVQCDLLDGKTNKAIHARQLAPGIYVEGDLAIDASVRLEGPLLIGKGAHLQTGTSIGAYSVIGSQTVVSEGSVLTQAILWENSYVGTGTKVLGSIVGRNASVGDCVLLGENAVVGDGCRIGRAASVKAGVSIWPHKAIEEAATVNHSVIYGNKQPRSLFGNQGIAGVGNVDITPEFVTRLAGAYACELPMGSRVALCACEHPFAQLLKHSIMTSLCSAGIDTVDIGVGSAPLLRYGVQSTSCTGGIHIQTAKLPGEKRVTLLFVDQNGLPITREMQQSIELAYRQERYGRSLRHLGQLHVEHRVQDAYIEALLMQVNREAIREKGYKLLIECDSRFLLGLLYPVLAELGITAMVGSIADGVRSCQADMGVRLLPNGEGLELFCHTGERLTEEQLVRLLEMFCHAPSEGTDGPCFHPKLDAAYMLVRIVDCLCRERLPLADLISAEALRSRSGK
ncbi:sugar phosphate nucleotidyltransferase [Brevibacillus borstelensis]|uniref:sugar phosphate nucleotidyltransferase n=1 Tax=Brevibacillus borstelensis TaxID=45462 RepID=UPI0030C4FC20